jgi:arylsulfatase
MTAGFNKSMIPHHVWRSIATAVFAAGLILAHQLLEIRCAAESIQPNILIIIADDLGFSDLGCYGGEIATPNLDALAAGGLRYTQFYNTARCWPTRSSLLTGYYAQQIRRDEFHRSDGQRGTRPSWARLLPEYLRPLGYRSYHSGKWHIDGSPLHGGFDRSYLLDDHNRHFAPQQHTLDDEPLPPVGPGSGYYSTVAIAGHAVDFLKQHASEHGEKPFFAYVAFTAPHFPLHALSEDISRYEGMYDRGWDEIRDMRWQRIQRELRLPGELSKLELKIGPPYFFAGTEESLGPDEVWREIAWNELRQEQQRFQAAKMQVHAAMVDRLDREIGRIISQLREMNALENTVVFFLSDNGASAEIMVRGDGHDRMAPFGSAESFICLGPGWSRAANTPFRRHKTWVHEGGIATPLIVQWPAGISARGELRSRAVGYVIDLAPTILQLAGGVWPEDSPAPRPPGRNLVATFDNDSVLDRRLLWWLHEGNRAIRVDNWKLVAARDEPWELYDLASDRAENHDLVSDHPEKVRELEKLWTDSAHQFRKDATRN